MRKHSSPPSPSFPSSSSSSSSSFTQSWTYDVFLSYRGEDTRKTFIDHLYTALDRQGIHTFIDDELPRGEEISPALLNAIEESKISMIVFSENYASSSWCLDELVKILEYKKSKQQLVMPIFYKVDPSDVRNQRSSFGDALVDHERKFKDDMEKVLEWRRALTEAANLSGLHFKEGGYEAKFINKVVEEISVQVLNNTYLDGPAYPVGIMPCVTDVNKLLSVDGNGHCMVGIWGSPGIGKTTIAKAVYNSIANKFEGSCFLADVREKSMYGGLIKLQEALLCQVLGSINFQLFSLDKGINVIKNRLSRKRILLILDDVNQLDQLEKLAGTGWFGEGSRVIVTTRDRGLLARHGIELIYEVKKLAHRDALELFSMISFQRKEPQGDYLALARRAIAYAQHLPLALTILGSHLRNQKLEYWHATLGSYEADPYLDIQKILRTSYDGLNYHVQQVFLDIACFFKGEDVDYVIQVLKGPKLNFPENCIRVLVENAIITIECNMILMHDLLEQMGKDIVHEESPNEPGKRSRLWFHEDVREVLTDNSGTNTLKGIIVNLPKPDEIPLNAKCFSAMKNLEFFINHNASLSGDTVDYFSNKLRVIHWGNCQLQYLPSSFQPKDLVLFSMPCSRIKQLGDGCKNLAKLMCLNLTDCKFLAKIPDLSAMENLKYLTLSGCKSLIEVDSSIGFLDKLVTLDLSRCSNLNFPEIVDKMDSLRELEIQESGIRELPSSIAYLSGLESLWAYGCESLTNISPSVYDLQNLSDIDLRECPKLGTFQNMINSEISSSAGSMPLSANSNISQDKCNLSKSGPFLSLNLSGNNFVALPVCISKLVNLDKVYLFGCKLLREIPEALPEKLNDLNLADCKSLEKFSKLPSIFEHNELPELQGLDLTNCQRLCADKGDYYLAKLEIFFKISRNLKRSRFEIVLPGNEVPKWFSCCVVHEPVLEFPSSRFIKIPRNLVWEKAGLVVCVVFEYTKRDDRFTESGEYRLMCDVHVRINGRLVESFPHGHYLTMTESTHVWFTYTPWNISWGQPDGGSCCEVTFTFDWVGRSKCVKFLSCGVHLLYPQDGDGNGDDTDVDDHEPSAVMTVDDDCGDDNDNTNVNTELSLSFGRTSPRKRPHGAMTTTNVNVDDQEQRHSLPLDQPGNNLRKRRHIDFDIASTSHPNL
ncbi:disease resistance protein RPV1-like [Prunus dulcis]|uniref:disease resistance protein RPV1-like n=1 Tax=Prunus dulcis TaxID=3755 RepID=UPI001482A0E5|nr:disease resistance protein RPV1-like [Prunus dulcis]